MVRNLSSQRDASSSTRERLHAHFAGALECDEGLLHRPALSIVATEARRAPDGHGWVMPLYGVLPHGSGACVLSCLPELAGPLRAALAGLPLGVQTLDSAWLEAVRRVATSVERAEWARQTVYAADRATFRPHGVDPSIRVERLGRAAYPDLWLSRAFDGPCFVIRDATGSIASWAGVQQKSDDAWEILAVTEPPYRGRGLATVLTATATEEILKQGQLALWVADADNLPSQRLVERLGFQPFADVIAARLFDPGRTSNECDEQ